MSNYDPLDEKVDLKKILDKLFFSEEDVINANLEQPKLMYAVARYRVQLMRVRMQKEASLKLVRAQAAHKYRKLMRDGKHLTEGAVREKVDSTHDVVKAEHSLDHAVIDEELAKQLFEVFKQRQIAINNIIKAGSNDIAKSLWELENSSKHKRLKDAAAVIKGRYQKKESDSDG